MNLRRRDMNTQEINRLLGKYYNGESSPGEEQQLKQFFESGDIPAELKADSEIFRYYSDSFSVPEASADLEARIISAIGDNDIHHKGMGRRRLLFAVLSAAAGILILVGSWFFFTRSIEPKDTYSDPRVAYAQAVSILYDVSSQLSRGTRALDPVLKFEDTARKSIGTVTRSTGMIDYNLRNLDYFQRAIKMVNDPMSIGINK
jgi:hypothetical protein